MPLRLHQSLLRLDGLHLLLRQRHDLLGGTARLPRDLIDLQLRRFRRAPVLEPYSVLSIHAQAHELLRQLYHISVVERHVLLIVPSVEGEALTLYHGQLRAAAHLIHRDVLAVILVVCHRAVRHGIDLRHGDAQLVPLITGGHRQPAGQLGHGIPGNIRQQHLRCVAPAVGDLLSRQPAEIRLHRVGGLLVAVRQHVHGTLGIRAVTVEIVRAQIAQGHGLPVWQLRRVVHDAVVLRPDAARVVFREGGPWGDLITGVRKICVPRPYIPLTASIGIGHNAVLHPLLQCIDIRLQALGTLPRRVRISGVDSRVQPVACRAVRLI